MVSNQVDPWWAGAAALLLPAKPLRAQAHRAAALLLAVGLCVYLALKGLGRTSLQQWLATVALKGLHSSLGFSTAATVAGFPCSLAL